MSFAENAENVSPKFRILIILAILGTVSLLVYFDYQSTRGAASSSPSSDTPPASPLHDESSWHVAEGVLRGKPVFTRFRVDLAQRVTPASHPQRFYVTWRYTPNQEGLPTEDTLAQLEAFELDVIAALERDLTCVFFSIQTYDGAREWTGYTRSSQQAVALLNATLAGRRLPLELRAEEDPTWSVYHALLRELETSPAHGD